jgi:hypothetical protein
MSDDLQHIKITDKTILPDGTVEISTESYYEKLAFTKHEYEKPHLVDRSNIMEKYINCLNPVMIDGSPEVTITIKKKSGGKWLITHRWTSEKKQFGSK